MQTEVKGKAAFAVVAAVQLPGVSDIEFEASLAELRDLSKTLGYKVVRTFTQKRTAFDTSAYLGLGKRVEIRDFINGSEVPDSSIGTIDRVFVDHEISPSQARNLENDVGCDVMDRTMVILAYSTATRVLAQQRHRWKLHVWAIWRHACAKWQNLPDRRDGSAAAPEVAVPANPTPNWTNEEFVTELPNCSRK